MITTFWWRCKRQKLAPAPSVYYHIFHSSPTACVVFTRDTFTRGKLTISIVLHYVLLLWNAFTSRKRVSCKHGIRNFNFNDSLNGVLLHDCPQGTSSYSLSSVPTNDILIQHLSNISIIIKTILKAFVGVTWHTATFKRGTAQRFSSPRLQLLVGKLNFHTLSW